MKTKNVIRRAVVAGCVVACTLGGAPGLVYALDMVSLEYGQGNKTKMTRVSAQWIWKREWWKSNNTYIGSYWDVSLAQWRGSRYRNQIGRSQDITLIGLTPVFRLQSDILKGFYIEGGIGAYLLSELYDNNDRQLSTSFQFGDHLGAGYTFANKLEIGIRFQHFSNASIKKPNDGINFIILRASYPF